MPDESKENVAETAAMPASDSQALRVVEVLDEYLAELKAGEQPDREALLAKHPALAEQLQACLAGMEFIHASRETDSTPRRLGDFEIIREVGRGGMGAVYEARQLSLGRRVALKILRFAGLSDPAALNRFQREAETVASLHHTNIVPIFAVGSEKGINYYAMQFIEGRSLDRLVRRPAQSGSKSAQADDFDLITRWGLQAADALAHAHARGVIHRDVKPSNLILDDEDRIWLTDFGLAKRLDDVTLSMTGALLGTPRYMSPEQASATHHKLDHRTDIYSLGATLYELATGVPVFSGNTPHDVISQIITEEPVPARVHCPAMPRDLETILMKCLSKESTQRYDSASQLADDLRAFLERRPIAARRVSLVERSARWLKRQRSAVTLALTAVAATLLLVGGSWLGAYAWHRSRLAEVLLRTDHPPLVAEFEKGGLLVAPPVTVPNQRALEIPAGEYQMRVLADRRLSQTFDVELKPQTLLDQKLDLEDQLLWGDLQFDRSYRLVSFSSPPSADAVDTDVILMDDDGIARRSHPAGGELWRLKLREPSEEMLRGQRLIWPWNESPLANLARGVDRFDARPWVVSGTQAASPLLLAAQHEAWLIAVDPDSGKPLWLASRGEANTPAKNAPWNGNGSAILYPPEFVSDRNGDGRADVLACWIDKPDRQQAARRYVELISGNDGETIWRYDIPTDFFTLPQGETVPPDLQWFYNASGGFSTGSSQSGTSQHFRTREASQTQRSGDHEYLPTRPRAVKPSSVARAFIAGNRLIKLDLNSGQPIAEPQVLPGRTGIEPRTGHFDDDATEDWLLTERLPDRVETRPGSASALRYPQIRLVAWSTNKQQILWQRTVEAAWPHQDDLMLPTPDWPHVADIDGDGICDVLVPDGSTEHRDNWFAPPWGKVALIDGTDGKTRWQRQLFNLDEQLECFITGPDIDDDGHREVFVAALWQDSSQLFVDCLSGADGDSLWRLDQTIADREQTQCDFRLGNLAWFDGLGDGWPQLIVTLGGHEGRDEDRICLISAGTGRLTHLAPEVSMAEAADFNADGIDDLALFRQGNSGFWDHGGTLNVVRGVGREAWCRLNDSLVVVGDLDGDGVRDSVDQWTRRSLRARSSATGKVIWHRDLDLAHHRFDVMLPKSIDPHTELLPTVQDLDGDAVSDLLLVAYDTSFQEQQSVLVAVSGQTGRQIWQSDFKVQMIDECLLLDCQDLDKDGTMEIVLCTASDYDLPQRDYYSGTNPTRLWLSVLSASDGKTRWAEALTEAPQPDGTGKLFDLKRIWLEAAYGDLNDDGVLDIVLPRQWAAGSPALALGSINGLNGSPLWKVELPQANHSRDALGDVPPALVSDLDGDGELEVVALTLSRLPETAGRAESVRVQVVKGASGERLWAWETASHHGHLRIGNNPDRVSNRLRAIPLDRPDGKQWIALSTDPNSNEQQLHVLDEQGQLISQLSTEQHTYQQPARIWAVNGSILLSTPTRLSLLPPNALDQPLWSIQERRSEIGRILGVLPQRKSGGDPAVQPTRDAQIVVLGDGGDYSLRGLDPLTGDVQWIVAGPSPSQLQLTDNTAVLLNDPTTGVPPHAMYQYHGKTLVRRSPVDAERSPQWNTFARPAATLAPLAYDRRLLRPLPWKPDEFALKEVPVMLASASLYGLMLVALPGGFLLWIIRRRQLSLKTLLVLPVIAGIVMLALFVQPTEGTNYSADAKIQLAFAALPVIVTLCVFAKWIGRRDYRQAALWLGVFVLLGTVAMGINLFMLEPSRNGALQPGERYDWDGWYWIYPGAAYLLCWATMVWLVVAGLTKASWQMLRRADVRTQPT